jgi:hypothetical protein
VKIQLLMEDGMKIVSMVGRLAENKEANAWNFIRIFEEKNQAINLIRSQIDLFFQQNGKQRSKQIKKK